MQNHILRGGGGLSSQGLAPSWPGRCLQALAPFNLGNPVEVGPRLPKCPECTDKLQVYFYMKFQFVNVGS